MNKIVLAFLVLTFSLNAQLRKGAMLLGVNFGYNYNKSKTESHPFPISTGFNESKNTAINTGYHYGYFITNRIAVGIASGYQYTKQHVSVTQGIAAMMSYTSYKSTLYSVGAFGRFYKSITDNKIAVFAHLRSVYMFGETTNTNLNGTNFSDSRNDNKGFGFSLSPGVTFFLTKNTGIEVSLGNVSYLHTKSRNYKDNLFVGTTKSDFINTNFSFSTLTVGVVFYLGGKSD